uniref:ATP synthase complex subunit 8 n=1 Tax=Phyllodactylus unctus TaxID=611294 RepID=K9JWT0_9SAUR|nr:ATP synthase F0 subunit 8 [Phyllodactylus unctus]ADY86060.1 ATPase subunit 8 [Phyllodactylus unctus]
MPQLNPAPWFYTLFLLWVTMATLMPLLLRLHCPTKPLMLPGAPHTTPWPWLWQ